jgi:hypothetical protein
MSAAVPIRLWGGLLPRSDCRAANPNPTGCPTIILCALLTAPPRRFLRPAASWCVPHPDDPVPGGWSLARNDSRSASSTASAAVALSSCRVAGVTVFSSNTIFCCARSHRNNTRSPSWSMARERCVFSSERMRRLSSRALNSGRNPTAARWSMTDSSVLSSIPWPCAVCFTRSGCNSTMDRISDRLSAWTRAAN